MFEASTQPKCLHRLDRLYAVVALLFVAGYGCDENGESAEADPGAARVNSVRAEEEEVPAPEAYCDRYSEPAEAQPFEFPRLEGDPPPPSEGWRWVNLWATWCKPCVEELPRLVDWREDLSEVGLGDLVLISADATRQAVDDFREKHPETPESLIVRDPELAKKWVKNLGLSRGAPLPVHVFVDPENRLRCLRAGGVGEDDYRAIERLLGG